jgi:CheY-like chemotaxis protein
MIKKKLLLVDDDSDDTELFSEAIGEIDSSVLCHCASDGMEALEKLSEKKIETPDLIFLDINMPEMNGWQFLERVKGNHRLKDIPVIIYTTSSTKSDLLHARTSGALCFVTKPANYGRLKKILEIVISYMEKDSLIGVCDAVHAYLASAN